jgi:hypothetical protein
MRRHSGPSLRQGDASAALAEVVDARRDLPVAKVFLVASRAYVGQDLAGARRLWLEEGEQPACDLAKSVFGGRRQKRRTTPRQAKHAFDQALLGARVEFLTHSFATDVLVDKAGRPAGVVIANRSGRQAITAKVLVDATPRAPK